MAEAQSGCSRADSIDGKNTIGGMVYIYWRPSRRRETGRGIDHPPGARLPLRAGRTALFGGVPVRNRATATREGRLRCSPFSNGLGYRSSSLWQLPSVASPSI